ncbi:MAG: YeeE/YedE family protein [Nitrospira bacterium SG8_35_1]|nr:MAG: YeeE/YedE family protein [Nitrospira bacterium SG8_35_1]
MEQKNTDTGSWSPYIAGGFSGLVIIVSVLWTGQFFGASTSFVRSAGMLGKVVGPERVRHLEYFIRYLPQIDWQLMFVIGIFVGSLIASVWSGSFKWQGVPDMWAERFGTSPVKRGIVAFVGGIIAMFGARLAGGCPSGHGLSGMIQLAVSGLIAMIFFFVGGIIMTRLIYCGGNK